MSGFIRGEPGCIGLLVRLNEVIRSRIDIPGGLEARNAYSLNERASFRDAAATTTSMQETAAAVLLLLFLRRCVQLLTWTQTSRCPLPVISRVDMRPCCSQK